MTMIKKLRLKFIIFSMSIVLVMLCIIAAIIFLFTKKGLENDSINMMKKISHRPLQINSPNNTEEENVRLPYFVLQINSKGELESSLGGYYDLSEKDFLKKIIDIALSNPENTGLIKEYGLRYYHTANDIREIIVYSDISSEIETLNSLMKTCIFIIIISFIAFLIICYFLSGLAVKPVEQAWSQQKQFIADASHELKTPLTVIITNAELIQNPEYDEKNKAAFLSGILTMSREMRALLEQMLELLRADSVQYKMGFSNVNLSQLSSDSVLTFEPVFFENGLTLNSQISENIYVSGNAAQLRQIVDIFLDNARKYSVKNGNVWITLKKHKRGRCILSVANEGNEIPSKDLKNLFKRFYRADSARSINGSFGLGLSIAESIAAGHKGSIWAESKNGINTFFIELSTVH